MAPVNLLCTQFLKSLLVGDSKSDAATDDRSHVSANGDADDNSDDDEDMHSDDNEWMHIISSSPDAFFYLLNEYFYLNEEKCEIEKQ